MSKKKTKGTAYNVHSRLDTAETRIDALVNLSRQNAQTIQMLMDFLQHQLPLEMVTLVKQVVNGDIINDNNKQQTASVSEEIAKKEVEGNNEQPSGFSVIERLAPGGPEKDQ